MDNGRGIGGPQLLRPNWHAPATVRAAFSLRSGGVSTGPYRSLNLGTHVGDDPAAVAANRAALARALQLPAQPVWLQQVHGTRIARVDEEMPATQEDPLSATGATSLAPADGAITRQAGRVLTIMVADCLPVLFASADGLTLAVAHAGWRGLVAGVLEAAVQAMAEPAGTLHAWIGPGIGPERFEVGPEVRAAFVAQEGNAARHFRPGVGDRWLCNLPVLARERLRAAGVTSIAGGEWCTASDADRYFSHRRDGLSGRMAALLWRV